MWNTFFTDEDWDVFGQLLQQRSDTMRQEQEWFKGSTIKVTQNLDKLAF